MKYAVENFYASPLLPNLNRALQYLFSDFPFSMKFITIGPSGEIQSHKDTLGIVVEGSGTFSKVQDGTLYSIGENDLVFMRHGARYRFVPEERFGIYSIGGSNVLPEVGDVVFSGKKYIMPGIAGGTRKTLKEWDGKDYLDIHLIWVDEKNIKIPHYHERFAELYVVQNGTGTLHLQEVDDYNKRGLHYQCEHDVEKGSAIIVPQRTIHNTTGNMIIHVVGIPYFYPDDIKFVE